MNPIQDTTIRTPEDWDSYDVRCAIPMGGCGDDVAEITEIIEIGM